MAFLPNLILSVCIFTIICASSPFLFIKINRMKTYPDLKSSVDRAGCTQAICIICHPLVNLQQAGWEVILFFQCGLVDVEGRLLHYLALGSLLFMFLWLVRLLRTQLLASEASLELIAPFLCSQLHSSPSSSGSSSSSSTSLSTSLRSSRSTCGEENIFDKTSSWCIRGCCSVFPWTLFSPCPWTQTCRPCAGWGKPRRCAELAGPAAVYWRRHNPRRA